MADTRVTVVARIKAKPGMEARVREELHKLLVPTRTEAGCLNFDMHQSLDNEGDFLFHENWNSKQDLERHFQSPHIQRWLKISDELCAAPVEIGLWKQVG